MGKVYEAMSVSLSVPLPATSKEPPPLALGLKYARPEAVYAPPVAFESVRLRVGSEVSTLTVVEMETVLPTLSVPVSVYL